jgi:fructose-1,6-bisphosphatase/inositol monophosphatase family enzyme
MFGSVRNELECAIKILGIAGGVAYLRFHGQLLNVEIKPDGSKVTDLDLFLSDWIVQRYKQRGISVISEEGGTATYGARNVVVIDPVDGTSDIIDGQRRSPRISLAAISIGWLGKANLRMGAVCFPLLGHPMLTYGGGDGVPAFRTTESKRGNVQLNVDAGPTRGTVIVSSKTTSANEGLRKRLKAAGFETLALHGAVFKACLFVDPELGQAYKPVRRLLHNLPPIVGFETGGFLHDIAGTVPIARAAGAVVTSRSGGQIDFGTGRGCIMANNPETHKTLLRLVNG